METVSAPLRVFVEEGDASLEPTTFGRGGASELSRHESAIEATRAFLRERYARKGFGERFKRLDKALAREADKLSSRLHRLEERVNRGSREEEYRRAADLLLANVGALRKGEKSATVEDYYRDGEPTTIKLKENASPQENVDRYYEKARDERVSFERSKTMLAETKRRYDELSRKRTRLDEATQTKELDAMLDELGGGRGAKRGGDDLASKFKQYIIDGKYRLYVGKDGANNDLLTQRFAKPNDYWFHARAVPGSHAVLKIDNAKEEVPKSALKKAASIAAFHSKAKTAGTVPVSCTLKKYVFKRKGAPLGQVQLKREDSLLVRPGVPEGCEFVDD
jgi:predicted ribosome quality control (RQC) complex YloA/Tae2 family protein